MLEDRTYMRNQSHPQGELSALKWLLIINVGAFILQNILEVWFGSQVLANIGALSSTNLNRGYIWTFASYAFLHSSLFHILINMLVVFFIGRIIEQELGSKRLVQIYLVSAIVGGAFWMLLNLGLPDILLGASGAGFGILAYFCLRHPEQKITLLLFFVIPVTLKSKWLGWGLLGIEIFSLIFYELPGKTVVASSAHLGGMLGGLIMFYYLSNAAKTGSFSKNSPSQKVATVNYKINVKNREQIRAEVDRILDKINSKGFGALSSQEKQLLDDAKEWLNKE